MCRRRRTCYAATSNKLRFVIPFPTHITPTSNALNEWPQAFFIITLSSWWNVVGIECPLRCWLAAVTYFLHTFRLPSPLNETWIDLFHLNCCKEYGKLGWKAIERMENASLLDQNGKNSLECHVQWIHSASGKTGCNVRLAKTFWPLFLTGHLCLNGTGFGFPLITPNTNRSSIWKDFLISL